jgi:hypothetical protein
VGSTVLKVRSSARGSSSSYGTHLSNSARARADVDNALDRITLSLSVDALDCVFLRLEHKCTRSQHL